MTKLRHHGTAVLICTLYFESVLTIWAQAQTATNVGQTQTSTEPAIEHNTSITASAYHSMREGLAALKAAKEKDEQERIYQHFQEIPVNDHDDLMALYKEARRRQDSAPLITTNAGFDEYVRHGQIISGRLKTVTDPALHDDIATLIDEETKSLSSASDIPSLPIGNVTLGSGARSAVRVVRIHSLIDAAGDGKNEKARAALWRMVDSVHDAYFGQMAVVALGKIGKPEDLTRLIQMVKADPNLHFEFTTFGRMAIPVLLQEIRAPGLSETLQRSLAGGLVEVATHDSLSVYVAMLHDSNRAIARAAARAVSKNLSRADGDMIMHMLDGSSGLERNIAINVIDGSAWDERYVPKLIEILRNDRDNLDAVSHCLSHHHVRETIPVFQNLLNDPSPAVKRRASQAITEMNAN